MGQDVKITLCEIQDNIIEVLKSRTVDDFYAECDLGFTKEAFLKLTNLENESQIDQYLEGRFPETVVEKFLLELEKEIEGIELKLFEIPKILEKAQADFDANEAEIAKIDKGKQAIPNKIRNVELEIEEIEKGNHGDYPSCSKSTL